jgi:LysR family glycine cleavage system transcriptional activator
MHAAFPPLNALRAFEAAARHLSLTKAAEELRVTPSALSHQIKGLEDFLGVRLFERRGRAIDLTDAGRRLYPGLHGGLIQIRDAVASLRASGSAHILVVSAAPGFTAKWLAPRLYRFALANPDIDVRISSSLTNANFRTDGVDVAIRNMPVDQAGDAGLVIDRLVDLVYVPVISPTLKLAHGGLAAPEDWRHVPLIHDESLMGRQRIPGWADWFRSVGITGVDINRGLRFTSADHAIEAAIESAGVLLAATVMTYDDVRTGRLVTAADHSLWFGRMISFICPALRVNDAKIATFRAWLASEIALMPQEIRDRAVLAGHV